MGTIAGPVYRLRWLLLGLWLIGAMIGAVLVLSVFHDDFHPWVKLYHPT